ncbi:hypothetical protein GCAAIG_11150 [Candidatus Electronema halotolerans]
MIKQPVQRGTAVKFLLPIFFFYAAIFAIGTAQAAASMVRKLCYLQAGQAQGPQLLVSSDASSQAAAIEKNGMLQSRRIIFGDKQSKALFHKSFLRHGDCLLVNPDETMSLDVYEELPSGLRRKVAASSFLPAVYYAHQDKSKHYGLLEQSQLPQLTAVSNHHESSTDAIVNYAQNLPNDLFLIYITCPADRNSLCDLRIRNKGAWLKEAKTGKTLTLKVLARSQRENNTSGKSQRTHVNSDTPQGLYYIWGAVTGGGTSAWHHLARLDLDAALPPINSQPYNIHSYLLSKIVPDAALDDYWLNEWPLAYSLGRVFLRIAPGDFEGQENKTAAFSGYNTTEGCINTGRNHKMLLKIMVDAGIFSQDEVFSRVEQSASKQWHVASKLGKALVLIKDQD